MENQINKSTLNDKIAEFVSSSRNIFIGLLAVVTAVVIVYGAIVIVSLNGTVKALADIDSISYTMTKDSAALTDAELDAKKDSALVSLAKYTEKRGVAGVRANMLTAEIQFSKKDNEAAAKSWIAAAEKGKKVYTAPLSYFNAAVAYENAGNLNAAEETYKKVLSYKDFDQIAHAKFSLARVLEAKGDVDAALTVYNELFESSENDSWAKLAKSRIIVLSADKE